MMLTTTADRLVYELHRREVRYLTGTVDPGDGAPLEDEYLLAGLAIESNARMKWALVALLLQRPQLAGSAAGALELLDAEAKEIFKVYYASACYLQSAYSNELNTYLPNASIIPDLFSVEFDIPPQHSAEIKLKALAQQHERISGQEFNWHAAYHHVAAKVIRRLKKESRWART